MIRVKSRIALVSPALNALAVLADESGFDFGAALVGGAVRDAFHGVQPGPISDQDIAVFGPDVAEAMDDIELALFHAGYKETARFSDEGDYADGQIWLVIKYEHPEFSQVDLLVHPDAATVEDVVNTFDFNINQFAAVVDPFHPDLDLYYYGETNLAAIQKDGGVHDLFAQDTIVEAPYRVLIEGVPVDKDRVAKMVRIADMLGWSVPPRFRE